MKADPLTHMQGPWGPSVQSPDRGPPCPWGPFLQPPGEAVAEDGVVERAWGARSCPRGGSPERTLVEPLPTPPLPGAERSPCVLLSPQDRDNSPSSCAGLFIASHIGFDWPGVWVHLDIAAPVHTVSPGSAVVPSSPPRPATLAQLPLPSHASRPLSGSS